MVCAIVLNAFSLLESGRRQDRILYAIIVILCAQLHIVGYVFLFYLFTKYNETQKTNLVYFVVLGIISILALGMNAFFGTIILTISKIIPGLASYSSRIISSIEGIGTSFKTGAFLLCKQVFLYVLTERACKIQMTVNPAERKRYSVISRINTLTLAFIPICILNASFTRVFNPFLLVQYAMILNVGNYKAGISDKLVWNQGLKSALICLTVFVFAVSIHSNPDDFIRMMNSIKF